MKKTFLLLILLLLLPLNSWQPIKIEDLKDDNLTVSVVGEVKTAITVEIKKGSKIVDLLQLIEVTSKADFSRLNLNDILENNDVINIQSKNSNLISINTADIELLVLLNGIGEKTAIKIIEYQVKQEKAE